MAKRTVKKITRDAETTRIHILNAAFKKIYQKRAWASPKSTDRPAARCANICCRSRWNKIIGLLMRSEERGDL